MTESEERAFLQGEHLAWRRMLGLCIEALGGTTDDPLIRVAQLEAERAEIVAALRSVCERHGDNDWPNDLHLADVIRRHLENYLEEDE